jgi:two-component system response regulator HydG
MAHARSRIAAVDDDPSFLRLWERLLSAEHDVHTFLDPQAACDAFEREDFDLLLVDMEMPNLDGLAVLGALKHAQPAAEAIMVTGRATFDLVVQAMRAGAYDFLAKPLENLEVVLHRVEGALERRRLRRANLELERQVGALRPSAKLRGESRAIRQIRALIEQIADAPAPVLVTGETGTGKELVARALHASGRRHAAPFVPVNCSAIPDTLVDSELFGHEKGAFTGAHAQHRGLFEAAHGGVLFLDEIGDVPPATQVRLLRALQEGEIRPVGATRARTVDVRVVCATNVDLEKAIDAGRFRSDLFYRISTFRIEIPPLRARKEDLAPIAQALLEQAAARAGKAVVGFSAGALEALAAHDWPGNVRELGNVIEHAVTLATGSQVDAQDLPAAVGARSARRKRGPAPVPQMELGEPVRFSDARQRLLSDFEERYLRQLVADTGGNLSEASRRSGIDRPNLRRMLKRLGIEYAAASGEA